MRARRPFRILSVPIMLVLWYIAAVLIAQPLLLPSPLTVIGRLFSLCTSENFLIIVLPTFEKILGGTVGGIVIGTLLAVPAARYSIVEDLLWPFMTTVRTVPVVSFIILCLMWLSSRQLPGFIAFLMSMPIIYNNMLSGLKSTDRKLDEMAYIFRMPAGKRFLYIRLPQLMPHLTAAAATATGLAWKAGVAAELIGVPSGTIGEQLYRSKVYFETADLFAWTLVIIILSVLTEKLLLALLKTISRCSYFLRQK